MSDASLTRPRFTFPPPIAAIGCLLPQFPHSAALAVALNAFVRPTLPADALSALAGHAIALQISDAGIDCRVRLDRAGFVPCRSSTPPAVTIRAAAYDYWLLARRQEDPDTLFFARRLVIEGDTALGLTVKNALDAVDWTPAALLAAVKRLPFGAGARSAME